MGLLSRVKKKIKELTAPVSYHSAFGEDGVRQKPAQREEDHDPEREAELKALAEGRR